MRKVPTRLTRPVRRRRRRARWSRRPRRPRRGSPAAGVGQRARGAHERQPRLLLAREHPEGLAAAASPPRRPARRRLGASRMAAVATVDQLLGARPPAPRGPARRPRRRSPRSSPWGSARPSCRLLPIRVKARWRDQLAQAALVALGHEQPRGVAADVDAAEDRPRRSGLLQDDALEHVRRHARRRRWPAPVARRDPSSGSPPWGRRRPSNRQASASRTPRSPTSSSRSSSTRCGRSSSGCVELGERGADLGSRERSGPRPAAPPGPSAPRSGRGARKSPTSSLRSTTSSSSEARLSASLWSTGVWASESSRWIDVVGEAVALVLEVDELVPQSFGVLRPAAR